MKKKPAKSLVYQDPDPFSHKDVWPIRYLVMRFAHLGDESRWQIYALASTKKEALREYAKCGRLKDRPERKLVKVTILKETYFDYWD